MQQWVNIICWAGQTLLRTIVERTFTPRWIGMTTIRTGGDNAKLIIEIARINIHSRWTAIGGARRIAKAIVPAVDIGVQLAVAVPHEVVGIAIAGTVDFKFAR